MLTASLIIICTISCQRSNSKFLNSEGTDYKYVFKVVSWGDIYYIDFDEYKQYVNPFTTIVKIGQY